MKLKLVPAAAALIAAVVAIPAQAGALAAADMTISGIGLVDVTGAPFTGTITISNEQRTGIAGANYNGVEGTGIGAGSISSSVTGATVDVKYRCAGDCGPATAALYGGTIENNTTTHLAPPPQGNFAVGDMLLSGSALNPGTVSGLTRANASATGPTNEGGANATILNSARLSATLTVGTTFTGSIAVVADAYLRAFVTSPSPQGEFSQASSGYGWGLTITDTTTGAVVLSFVPSELNKTFSVTGGDPINDQAFAFTGPLFSAPATFVAGRNYQVTINQSSNAAVQVIPEPTSIALIGAALLAAGAATRRSLKK